MRLSAAIVAAFLTLSSTGAYADSWLGPDKLKHYVAGAGIAAAGYGASALAFERREPRVGAGLTVAVGAGAVKEWRDRSHAGTPSWRDFTWSALGAATGVTLSWLVDRAIHRR